MNTIAFSDVGMIWGLDSSASITVVQALAEQLVAYTQSHNPVTEAMNHVDYVSQHNGIGESLTAAILIDKYISALVGDESAAMFLISKKSSQLLLALYAWQQWWNRYLETLRNREYANRLRNDMPNFTANGKAFADLILKYAA